MIWADLLTLAGLVLIVWGVYAVVAKSEGKKGKQKQLEREHKEALDFIDKMQNTCVNHMDVYPELSRMINADIHTFYNNQYKKRMEINK